MINEANASSSACRLWRVSQVETSTPPTNRDTFARFVPEVKREAAAGSGGGGAGNGVLEFWILTRRARGSVVSLLPMRQKRMRQKALVFNWSRLHDPATLEL